VTKCVILASRMVASNSRLERQRNGLLKGMEHVPYGPKLNENLIRCHLQGFGKNLGGFEKIDPGAENRVLLLKKMARKRRFREVIQFETVWPGDLPWWCHALNYGRYMEQGAL
jgi:hypothetical protein